MTYRTAIVQVMEELSLKRFIEQCFRTLESEGINLDEEIPDQHLEICLRFLRLTILDGLNKRIAERLRQN